MKTFTQTFTLDARFAHLYRPLARKLILIIIATVVLMAAVLAYSDHRLVNSLSERLIEKSTLTIAEKLHHRFDTTSRGLRIAQRQIDTLKLDAHEWQGRLFAVLEPFLAEYNRLDSINLADSAGNEYVLFKRSGEIRTRFVDASTPSVGHWQRWVDGKVMEEWTRQIDVSPKDRPWYQGALRREPGAHYWTQPYAKLTTEKIGVSVASRWPRPDGSDQYVMAFNITLDDISRYTAQLRPSDHGMTVIFNEDYWNEEYVTIGHPPTPTLDDGKALSSAVLLTVRGLGVAALDAALDAWEADGRSEGIIAYSTKDQVPWWAGFSSIELDEEHAVWSAVLIPESDVVGSIAQLRNLSLAGTVTTGILLAAVVFITSMRSIRRQMRAAVDQVERKLGQYQLKQKIGEGGNGAVYRAQHALLRRPTAIKLMNPDYARNEAARERFEREVQITSSLNHPNTIAIYDYGQTPDGTLYYAMELLAGSTLERLLRFSGPLPAGRVIYILEQMAGSLAEAHEKGLIHRDIKPSNAILGERGGLFDFIKMLDFGLVKELTQVDGDLTHANVLIGTPLYMAPEIISQPGQASPQSDLYALGAVGYFLLTARNVFEGESAVEICAKHLSDPPMPPSKRAGLAVPEDLEAIILACLEKDLTRRPGGAAKLRDSLIGCRDAGSWTQQNAREWWQAHSTAFTGDDSPHKAPSLSKTELLVDLDKRMMPTGVNSAKS